MKFLFLTFVILISSTYGLTQFRCEKTEDLYLLRNQKVNIPFKCSQKIGKIEITPKLPNGLEIIDNRIVGSSEERYENNHYRIRITSAVTSENYDDTFSINSISRLREVPKGIADARASENYITSGTYWYVYSNATGEPDKDWMKDSFNPALNPFEWIYSPANNFPYNSGQKFVFYKTTFQYTNDVVKNMRQMRGLITVDGAFGIMINGYRIFSKGISLDDFGDCTKPAVRDIVVEDYELMMPLELFIYGENTIEIAVHEFENEDQQNKEKRMSFTLSAFTSQEEVITQTIGNVGSNGMTIIADKKANTASPKYGNLVDGKCGTDFKLSLSGVKEDESSLFPNKLTCSFPKNAKYFNTLVIGTVTNNGVLPKKFSIEATVEMIGEKGVDSEWEELYSYEYETSGGYGGTNKMVTHNMKAPSNFHLYEGYRMIIFKNFGYTVSWGNYIEIGEFVVQYKSMPNCKEEGFSNSLIGSYGTKVCSSAEEYGFIKKECTADGFSSEEINECKPKMVSDLVYPNEGVASFYVNYNNSFAPTYKGLAKSFSIDCGEENTELEINKYGVVYGSPNYEFEDLSCRVLYEGEEGDKGEATLTLSNLYCEEGNFPKTVAGEYAEIESCKTINEVFSSSSAKYYCKAVFPPVFEAVERCRYAEPRITYPDTKYEFVKNTEITPVEPSSVENYHTSIYFSAQPPPGLSIDSETGVITGRTDGTIAIYQTEITIKNDDGQSTIRLTISVVNKLTTTIAYENMVAYTGIPFKSKPPQIDDDSIIGTCSIEPELPKGLTLSCRTGVISGTNYDQLDGYSETHVVRNNAGAEGSFTLTIEKRYCEAVDDFPLTYPGEQGTKPCSLLGIEGKEYGDVTRECSITNQTTKEVEWLDPTDKDEAYPKSFDVTTLTAVTKRNVNIPLGADPAFYNKYVAIFDPPLPKGSGNGNGMVIFPKGSSYIESAEVTLCGDVNITKTYDFKIYSPTCEGNGFPRTPVDQSATKRCTGDQYGTIVGTCRETETPPYQFEEDKSGCHSAYPTNVEWIIPEKMYVAFTIQPIVPKIENPPDTISFEWKDDKAPGGVKLDGRTGIISGKPTRDTQNDPDFTIIVHGDKDVEYPVKFNIIQLKCQATDIFPEAYAGENAEGSCRQGEVGSIIATCEISQSSGEFIAEFGKITNLCEGASPTFSYHPDEKGYILGKDNIHLIPEYDANIFSGLTWTFDGMPEGVTGNANDGSITGIPTSSGEDNKVVFRVTASTGNKQSEDNVELYIGSDYRCVAKGSLPTSIKGVIFDSPCVGGKIGNQRVECLSGGKWSDVITSNCTDPPIHSEENELTVVFAFTARGVNPDDLTLLEMEGLKLGLCSILGFTDSKSCNERVQVAVVGGSKRRTILADDDNKYVEFNAYIVTDKEKVTQAYVEENLPNFPIKKTFIQSFEKVFGGDKLAQSKLNAVLEKIEAPKQSVTIPKAPEAEKKGLDDTTLYIIIGVAAAVGILIILIICCLICYCKRVKTTHGGASKAPVKKRGTKV